MHYANTVLKTKMRFGSDFAALPIRDEVRPLILKAHARRLLRP